MAKAQLSVLEELHNKVAEELMKNLDDPKALNTAIKFLKDNNITVDLQESKPTQSLFSVIESIKVKPEDKSRDKIEVILEDYVG